MKNEKELWDWAYRFEASYPHIKIQNIQDVADFIESRKEWNDVKVESIEFNMFADYLLSQGLADVQE